MRFQTETSPPFLLRQRDLDEKRAVYASLGVSEHFLFDPNLDALRPPLQGYRRRGGAWEQLPEEEIGREDMRGVRSETLGLALRFEEGGRRDEKGRPVRELRGHDPTTGEDMRTYEAQDAARRAAEERAAREGKRAAEAAAARVAAEARIVEQEAQLARLGARPGGHR